MQQSYKLPVNDAKTGAKKCLFALFYLYKRLNASKTEQ